LPQAMVLPQATAFRVVNMTHVQRLTFLGGCHTHTQPAARRTVAME
jgi:hypothetical protein